MCVRVGVCGERVSKQHKTHVYVADSFLTSAAEKKEFFFCVVAARKLPAVLHCWTLVKDPRFGLGSHERYSLCNV